MSSVSFLKLWSLATWLSYLSVAHSFLINPRSSTHSSGSAIRSPTSSPTATSFERTKGLNMVFDHQVGQSFSNLVLATIDSDIANIPENEFAPIFAGGIFVMFGGLLSALVVGFIVDKNDSYAQIVADSYIQQESEQGQEEFWKGLSEEEKLKAERLLDKVRGADGKVELPTISEATKNEKKEENKSATKVDMFSDYE